MTEFTEFIKAVDFLAGLESERIFKIPADLRDLFEAMYRPRHVFAQARRDGDFYLYRRPRKGLGYPWYIRPNTTFWGVIKYWPFPRNIPETWLDGFEFSLLGVRIVVEAEAEKAAEIAVSQFLWLLAGRRDLAEDIEVRVYDVPEAPWPSVAYNPSDDVIGIVYPPIEIARYIP